MVLAPALAAALLACLPRNGARGAATSQAGQIVGQRAAEEPVPQVSQPWAGKTCPDLHREYGNIFLHGSRNAASHLWSWFILERSSQMSHEQFVYMFSCFCAVSGSPTRPGDFNRYKLTLQKASGNGSIAGFMHYCCWPCVCDTQDFIKVDTKTIVTAEGTRVYNFAVLGNPCEHPEELRKPFQDAFGRGMSTLTRDAAEVRCDVDGTLNKAPLSDHGYIIINMFFDFPDGADPAWTSDVATPGRVTERGGVRYQDEAEYGPMCLDRAANGYNSGMGEIFRKVAAISPIQTEACTESLPCEAGFASTSRSSASRFTSMSSTAARPPITEL